MIDSIKLYQIVDEIMARKDIVHPAVEKIYELDEWEIRVITVNRTSASLMLYMRFRNLIRIRYKWFRRIGEILNKLSANSGITFTFDAEDFECEFNDTNSAYGRGVSGWLAIYAHDEAELEQARQVDA